VTSGPPLWDAAARRSKTSMRPAVANIGCGDLIKLRSSGVLGSRRRHTQFWVCEFDQSVVALSAARGANAAMVEPRQVAKKKFEHGNFLPLMNFGFRRKRPAFYILPGMLILFGTGKLAKRKGIRFKCR